MGSIAESVFTFLFKYPPRVFQRGEFLWSPVVSFATLALILGGVLIVVALATRNLRVQRPLDKVVLGVIRILIFLLIAGCLLRPTLALSSAVSQRNVLAVLLDDSRSMQIKDVNGARRLDAEQRVFADSSAIVTKLSQKFALRFFRFGADASPVSAAKALTGAAARTDLGAALDGARQELADLPVAGLILVSDGADNGATSVAAPLQALKARHIPIYTVGVGQERFAKDLAIDRLTVPPTTLEGAGTSGTVSVSVRGASGDSTTLTIEADGRMVASVPVVITSGRDVVEVPVKIPALPVGTHVVSVKVVPLKAEMVTENNDARTILRVRPRGERILYVEGSPRWEFGAIRRGLLSDSSMNLVTLLRSAKGKFLRLGVRDSLELQGGFPTQRSDLYQYRVLILGDVEASFFTGDQLRMLADFVDRRGGALIALGGRSSLAEGSYRGTLLAEALPFDLEAIAHRADDSSVTWLNPVLTAAGAVHPALQLASTPDLSRRRWDSLPQVTSVNELGALKPGATLLLEGATKGGGKKPLLAFQRYGRGLTMVLGAQDTWLWKMDPRTPVEDQSFETIWRQLLRWSLDQVADRIEVASEPQHVGPGEPATIRARVTDSIYMDVNDAAVSAQVRSPAGRLIDVPLEWTLHDDGTYIGHFVPDEQGVYTVTALAARGIDTTRSSQSALLVDPQGADMDRVELRTGVLKNLSSETGGKYYPIDALSSLPEDVVLTNSGITSRESRDLWDMPVVLFALFALLAGEWGYRRWRGLA